jgi:hypothetical protein
MEIDMDNVDRPQHYLLFPEVEVVDVIRSTLTPEEWRGWLKGNILKYRLRAGNKGNAMVDIAKADKNSEWLFSD